VTSGVPIVVTVTLALAEAVVLKALNVISVGVGGRVVTLPDIVEVINELPLKPEIVTE
tara:strand:+ start:741 stop:914 length:174 start_codon:yes stop_codon:yes gene_type:complete